MVHSMKHVPHWIGVLSLLAGNARAQVVPVAPFDGDAIESFESYPQAGGGACLAPRIFGNRADLCSTGGVTTANGVGGSGTIFSYSGVRLAAGQTAPLIVIFDTPVHSFGGKFGTVASQSGGTARFYDAGNVLIGTQPIAATSCTLNCGWSWNGWSVSSGPLISRVEMGTGDGSGSGLTLDDLVALYGSVPTGTHFCNGDQAGLACPCTNFTGHLPRGCFDSAFVGARLTAGGVPSLAADTVVLQAEDVRNPGPTPMLFFQGTTRVNGGTGAAFGDGIRCAGGAIVRLAVRTGDSGGNAVFPAAGDPLLHVRGQVAAPGVRTYQVWYRDPGAFCSSATWNLSNGFEITWAP
jgi:hypothetical protein